MTRAKLTNEVYDKLLFEKESPFFRVGDVIGSKVKIDHICINDHVTSIRPSEVLSRNSDCSYCSGTKHNIQTINNSLSTKKYAYTCLQYSSGKSNSLFQCHNCDNEWFTRADGVLNGAGCPKCSIHGFKPYLPGSLYYIKIKTFHQEIYYKIGITNLTISERFRLDKDKEITVLLWKSYKIGKRAQRLEQYFLRKYKQQRIRIPKLLKSGGNTELFEQDILNKDLDK